MSGSAGQRLFPGEHQWRRSPPWLSFLVMRIVPTKFVLIAAVAVIVSIFAVCLCLRSRQPSYNGQRLSYWFHELPITTILPGSFVTEETMTHLGRRYGRHRVDSRVSLSAIQGIGTNGLPFLMAKLSRDSGSLRLLEHLDAFAVRFVMKRALLADVEVERRQALTALLALPALPAATVAQLRSLSTNANGNIAASASYVLKAETETRPNLVLGPEQ
jgi:hypothetical protein